MPEHAGSSADFSARGRSHGEAGVALILVFLSLLVLVVVAGEISITSSVDRSLAQSEMSEMRRDFAARAGLEVARSLLIQDLLEETERQKRGAQQSAFADADGADCASDSLHDVWADPQACRLTIAGDIEVRLSITDEDSKINLLWLACRDRTARALWKERTVRLLDVLREGTAHDLSQGEAEELTDHLEAWFHGERSKSLPVPLQSTMQKRARALEWSEERFSARLEAPLVFPFVLDDLAHVPGMTAELLDGFAAADGFVPGLRDVATVCSCLVFDPEDLLQNEPFVWPFMKEQKGFQERQERRQLARERLRADKTRHGNNGRVNVNTATYPVLRALLPPECVRDAGVRSIVAFCRETALAEGRPDGREAAPFPSSESLLARLAEITAGKFRADTPAGGDFLSALTVRSHVFTIRIDVSDAPQGRALAGSDAPAAQTSFRATLWRHQDHEGAVRLIPLAPLARCPAETFRPVLAAPDAGKPWSRR